MTHIFLIYFVFLIKNKFVEGQKSAILRKNLNDIFE